MITVRVYDDYNSIALQAVDTDDLEGWEFSKKFREKSSVCCKFCIKTMTTATAIATATYCSCSCSFYPKTATATAIAIYCSCSCHSFDTEFAT